MNGGAWWGMGRKGAVPRINSGATPVLARSQDEDVAGACDQIAPGKGTTIFEFLIFPLAQKPPTPLLGSVRG